MCHIKEGLLASVDNCNCAGTLLSFSRLQICVNSVFEDKEKENCLTKGTKFQFLCACCPRSPVTGLSGAKYIPNTCWNKQHTWVSSDEYSIQSCLLSEPDKFTHYFIIFFFSYSNAKTRSQGHCGFVTVSGRHRIQKPKNLLLSFIQWLLQPFFISGRNNIR